jgi:hypothetical protein
MGIDLYIHLWYNRDLSRNIPPTLFLFACIAQPARIWPTFLQRRSREDICTACHAGHGMALVLYTRACARGQVELAERFLAREPLNQATIGGWVPLAHEHPRLFVQ